MQTLKLGKRKNNFYWYLKNKSLQRKIGRAAKSQFLAFYQITAFLKHTETYICQLENDPYLQPMIPTHNSNTEDVLLVIKKLQSFSACCCWKS